MPHSRFNDLPEERLAQAGYQVLARADGVGADLFVKECTSLFVFVQGHPEYDRRALAREYRRDVGRFLSAEREHYPPMPHGHFAEPAAQRFAAFASAPCASATPACWRSSPTQRRRARSRRIGAPRRLACTRTGWRCSSSAPARQPRSAQSREPAVPAEEAPPAPVRALFPARAERLPVDDRLTRALADAQERVAAGSVVPTIDFERFRAELARFDFQQGKPLEELLDWTVAQLEQGVVHLTHPRYFGLFRSGPDLPLPVRRPRHQLLLQSPDWPTWTTSPVPVEIEAHVIAALARRAGMPDSSRGHFTSCGSEANYSALLCALTMANERFASDGVRAFGAPVVLYASADSHLAWIKIAHQTGIGRSAVRLVTTDGAGRMSVAALRGALAEDRAQGRIPR